jgi:integrase
MARKQQRRRRPGTGYTTREPNGNWKASFPKSTGYFVRKGFVTKAAAEAWLDELVKQREQHNIDIAASRQSFQTWAERWIERSNEQREWKPKTKADAIFKLGYANNYLSDYLLTDIRPDDIDNALQQLAKSLAANTIRQIRNYLYQVMEEARQRQYIQYNPVLKPLQRKKAQSREPIRLDHHQIARILTLTTEIVPFHTPTWWLISVLGLRAGEAIGLRTIDIDAKSGIITIAQSIGDIQGSIYVGTPKNNKVRKLPAPDGLLEMLQQHIETRLYKRRKEGKKQGYWTENQLLTPGRGGRPSSPSILRRQLLRLTNQLELPELTTHMMRHSAAKLYADINCPQHIIGALLGHSTSNITEHYAPTDIDAMRPYVEQVYNSIKQAANGLQNGLLKGDNQHTLNS